MHAHRRHNFWFLGLPLGAYLHWSDSAARTVIVVRIVGKKDFKDKEQIKELRIDCNILHIIIGLA